MSELAEQSSRMRIGEYLLSKGLITEEMLNAALAEQRITQERLGMILTRGGFITRKSLLDAILATKPEQIHGESFFSARVPAEILLETRTMIVAETEKQIFLSTTASERQARVDIAPYYPEAELVFVAADVEKVDNYLEDVRAMNQDNDSLVDKILRKAFSEGMSDIHIIPRYNSYSLFCRYLGRRSHTHEGTLDEYNTLAARIKDLSRMDLAERRIPQDGGFQLEFNGKLVDLRVSTTPVGNSEYITIRLLDPDRVQPTLTGLGITRVEEWRNGVSRPDGLCLICGPTGSGKTSTLNASLKEMDRFGNAIFTMEDPVEYRIPYLGQVNKNEPLGLDFARGIRSFMRMDPDVIVLGEIRDPETARNAIKAAETGHLVVGTLHTSNIQSTVMRLRDLDIPSHELVYQLRVILVQRLIRTVCLNCKGVGCKACFGKGFGGRTVVSECCYFPDEHAVRKLIAGEPAWWPTMLEDAIQKSIEGITTTAEVVRVFGKEARTTFEKLGIEVR
jgi:general secretion pathway protein E